MRDAHGVWRCRKEGCDLSIDEHGFALVVEHIYEGFPTKDGDTFGPEHAQQVSDGVARRLGWTDDEAWAGDDQ
mgnify:CR=1 FL=1